MSKSEDGSSDASRSQAPGKEHGTFDEARDLFDRMAGEAARQSQAERKAAKARRPLGKILLAFTLASSLFAAATMFYGMYYFPDAPIRQKAEGYVGKGGTARKQEDFEAFLKWEKAMLVAFPLVFVFGFGFGITEVINSRRG